MEYLSFSSTQILAGIISITSFLITVILLLRKKLNSQDSKILSEKYTQQAKSSFGIPKNKYPEADIFRFHHSIWTVGLSIALLLSVLAFNWTTYEEEAFDLIACGLAMDDLEVIPPATFHEPPPPPPPTPKPLVITITEEIDSVETPVFIDPIIAENPSPPPVIAIKKDVPPPPPPMPEQKEDINEIFVIVEQAPRFPGCENGVGGHKAKKACADKAMLQFIYQHIRYPAIARENGVQGTVVVQFVVETDGTIQQAKVVRDIGASCGTEALRVVHLMNTQKKIWTPGKQRGKAVRVQFNLPVKFRLE